MEYNFLLLEDNKLSIQKNKTFLQLTQENIDSLKEAYSLISINEIKGNNPLSPKVIELLKDNDCLLYTSPSPRDQRGSRMPSSA